MSQIKNNVMVEYRGGYTDIHWNVLSTSLYVRKL